MRNKNWSRIALVLLAFAMLSGFAMTTVAGEPVEVSTNQPSVVVESGESIQEAIDNASPGDTIEVQSGTYEEALQVDKNIELVANGDVRLDGNNVEAENGITVNAAEFRIDGLEIARFDNDGINIEGGILDGRTVEITNVTSRLNDGHNIRVSSNQGSDTVELRNVEANANGRPASIYVAAETVIGEGITVEDSDGTGLYLVSGEEGEVTIGNSTISGSGESEDFNEEHGIYVETAQTIAISDTRTSNNQNDGISVSGSDAIAGGRTVKITNLTATSNGDGNIDVGGTDDSDTAILKQIDTTNSGRSASIDVTAETVTGENITVEDSDGTGLSLSSGEEGDVTIANSTISDNGDEDFDLDPFHGIYVETAQTITITDAVVDNNENDGILIDDSDAIAGGRTVEITNVTANANGDNNIDIGGTADSDTAILNQIEANANGRPASIFVDTETASAENITVEDSDGTGLSLSPGEEGDVTIANSTISDNGDEDFDLDPYRGIYVETAQTITITDTIVNNNENDGILIDGSDAVAGGRTVEITNVTASSNGDNNIDIGGTADSDTVILNQVEAANNGQFAGIYIDVETIISENITVEDSDDAGLWLSSGENGEVTVRNSTISGSGADPDGGNVQSGIYVETSKMINISNSSLSQNEDHGLKIPESDAVAGGRMIEITNSSSRLNGLDGGDIGGTDDTDSLSITNSTFTENDENGLDIGTNIASVFSSEISRNSEIGLQFDSGIDNGEVNRSSIVDNSGAAVENREESTVIDATHNWWGDAGGPSEEDIIGEVLVDDPLAVPPGEEPAKAYFEVEIDSTNSPVTAGQPLSVTATVENTGGQQATQETTLEVPGVETNRLSVDLAAGDSQTVEFTVGTTPEDVGEYTATVSTLNDTTSTPVTVEAQPGEEDPLEEYRNENGEVDDIGLLEAIADWRNDNLADTQLLELIAEWRDT